MAYVLDTCALIAYLEDEAGADRVEDVISAGGCYLHGIHAYELFKDVIKRTGNPDKARQFLADLTGLVERLDAMDDPLMESAASLKVQFQMAIPDALGLAAAMAHGLVLLSSDAKELTAPQQAGYPIEFFR
ncbi:PIN domain-containing protein [Pseudoxanthomonas mexicana]|uniref:PIN domain-containing protein n=1 Tax=Pseudoxanthomonas mexicana TaxID=128785 RepID=A0A7G9TAU4_PSEMX|nr:PIN domain-containing protein [Pseudoxanthomonas mexicana]QNN77219.1 PIN domain-containing protein [Pseudoxanthomonas mexicana]